MIKTSRIRRTLAAVVGLALAGSMSAAAGAGAASAADDHLPSKVLLSGHDVDRAGWGATVAFTEVPADLLLGQCGLGLPYWSPGFQDLQRRGFQKLPDQTFGTELVMAFRTEADAKRYAADYAGGVDVCADVYQPKRWDIRSTSTLHLAHQAQHARTWTVRDTTGFPQTLSITLVRDHKRVALLWLSGEKKDDPAELLDLHRLVQRAATRMVA